MSSSFVIPLSALFDTDGDPLVRWNAQVSFYPEQAYDAVGNSKLRRIPTFTSYTIGVGGEEFEVWPQIEIEEDGVPVIKSVSFSGFYGTCQRLQSLLEISVEIY